VEVAGGEFMRVKKLFRSPAAKREEIAKRGTTRIGAMRLHWGFMCFMIENIEQQVEHIFRTFI
jgi:hypothetical protein